MNSAQNLPTSYTDERGAGLEESKNTPASAEPAHAAAASQGGAVPGVYQPRIVVGVAGGIAAYKSAHLVRLLKESGHEVRVIPTNTSLEFIGKATWEALSGNPVYTRVFEGTDEVMHVRLGREADLVVVAPATADLLARAVIGRADDMLTATLLTTTKPVLFAPAMHTEMWLHPATQENVRILRARGNVVLDPAVGRLTGKDTGAGRLPEPEDIFTTAQSVLRANLNAENPLDLAGVRIAISAGGTREAIDPVRFLGNRSTGHQGWALAQSAAARGAQVRLIAANVALPTPHPVERVDVESAGELQREMSAAAQWADVVVMAAAVADYRVVGQSDAKRKRAADGSAPHLQLEQNPDILAGLVRSRAEGGTGPRVIIGFAAETGDESGSVLEHGQAKARRKGADLLVVNQVGREVGFGDIDSAVHILNARGESLTDIAGSKTEIAHGLWDWVDVRAGR